MAIKYYTCFGPQNRVTDVMLNVVNPLGVDIAAAQIRPHDGGVNPMFTAHGSVDALGAESKQRGLSSYEDYTKCFSYY